MEVEWKGKFFMLLLLYIRYPNFLLRITKTNVYCAIYESLCETETCLKRMINPLTFRDKQFSIYISFEAFTAVMFQVEVF
jgi:hypothetical protein